MEDNHEFLAGLARKVDEILKQELEQAGIEPDFAEARIYDLKSVGVQGDEGTYAHPAEITLYDNGTIIWDPDFLSKLSSRITNEVKDINRVVYVTAVKKE